MFHFLFQVSFLELRLRCLAIPFFLLNFNRFVFVFFCHLLSFRSFYCKFLPFGLTFFIICILPYFWCLSRDQLNCWWFLSFAWVSSYKVPFTDCVFCLVIVNKALTGLRYKKMLELCLIPKLPMNGGQRKNIVFLKEKLLPFYKDNCFLSPWSYSSIIKEPAFFPDLSPIENLWGMMASDVDTDSTLYATLKEMKYAIMDAW